MHLTYTFVPFTDCRANEDFFLNNIVIIFIYTRITWTKLVMYFVLTDSVLNHYQMLHLSAKRYLFTLWYPSVLFIHSFIHSFIGMTQKTVLPTADRCWLGRPMFCLMKWINENPDTRDTILLWRKAIDTPTSLCSFDINMAILLWRKMRWL